MNDNNFIIRDVARTIIKPHGFTQKNRSRFWFKDLGWCAISVEFQPSSWGKGTYLNMAVSWLWYPKDYWSFDFDVQRINFVGFDSEQQFRANVESLAQKAIAYTNLAEPKLLDLKRTFGYVSSKPANDWNFFHLGLLAALLSRDEEARRLLSFVGRSGRTEWMIERNFYLGQIEQFIGDPENLRVFLEEQIQTSRKLLKLPKLNHPLLPMT
jgi:hypothetical protein